MKRFHRLSSLAALAAVLSILVVGCGGGDEPSGGSSSGGSSSQHASSGGTAGGDAVKISDFKFLPGTDTVKSGASVDVSNDDSTTHTATADDGHSFDTGDINPGSSKTVSVSKAGTYAYHCSIHPFMHGKLVVR
jgi:plastocyanin